MISIICCKLIYKRDSTQISPFELQTGDADKNRVNYSEWDPLSSLLKSDALATKSGEFFIKPELSEEKEETPENKGEDSDKFGNRQLSQNLNISLKFYKSGVRKKLEYLKEENKENRSMWSFINPLEGIL